jgi:La domain
MGAPVRGQQPQKACRDHIYGPPENAVVQQIEWYLGRQNLETDYFLKRQMDVDLWVPLIVILSFLNIQLLQVTDPAVVAKLLECASIIFEVDSSRSRIRPACARCSVLALTLPSGAVVADVEAIFSQKLNTLRRTSVVPISPVDGLWNFTFTGPEDAAVAVEIVADLSILSEKFIAHVHSSGFQSLILGTQLGGPAGPILSVRGVGSGSHEVSQGFYGSGGNGQGLSMG